MHAGERSATLAVADSVMEAVRADPVIEAASLSWVFPLDENQMAQLPFSLSAPGGQPRIGETYVNIVATQYFATMGVPLLAGRAFSEDDRQEAQPVVMVNATFAARYWPNESPLGQTLELDQTGQAPTVVGVVGDVRYFGGGVEAPAVVYIPHGQAPHALMTLVMRSAAEPDVVHATLQAAFGEIVPQMPVGRVRAATAARYEAFQEDWARLWALALMTLAALVCAMLGTVQLVADHVRTDLQRIERVRAEGMRGTTVLLAAWRPALLTTLGGVLIGLGAAWGLLHQIPPDTFGEADGVVFAWAVGAVVLALLGSSLIPARQALAIAPAP